MSDDETMKRIVTFGLPEFVGSDYSGDVVAVREGG
jgi:hypothetical protein